MDREERPDVDKIYMTFVQAMTGSGGWPLNAFITPDRKPFFGGTYWPPESKYGRPSFLQVLQQIAGQIANSDPQKAAGLIAQIDGPAQAGAAGQIADSWSRNDPTAAARWAAGLSNPEARTAAFAQIAGQWAEADPAAAARWIDTLPASSGRDAAVSTLARRITEADPAGAAVWATTIADASRRNETIERVARHWLRADEAAARTWIGSSQYITEELRTRLFGQR